MVLSSVAILIEFVVFDIKKNKWKNFQGSKGIRQWPINVYTSPKSSGWNVWTLNLKSEPIKVKENVIIKLGELM